MDQSGTDSRAHEHALLDTLAHLLAIPATEVKGALDEAAQVIAQVMAAEKIDVFLYDPSIGTLVALGVSATPLGRRQQELGLDRLPVANGGRTVEVFQTGEPYLTGHADQDPHVLAGVRGGMGVRSMLVVPLVVAGERRGVLAASSIQPDQFTPQDLRFLEVVARWVGMVAQRAELTERLAQEAANQARRVAAEDLINVVVHDLRTPLTPLRGHLDLILSRAQREGRHDYARNASEATAAAERLNRMISDLLDAGRLEHGLFSLAVAPLDLAALAHSVVAMLQPPGEPIRVHTSGEVVVEADPDRLRQALENLLSNALRHTPEGTPIVVEVRLEARDGGEWAVMTVHDEGPGIAAHLLPMLSNRFAPGPDSSGLGLGLYLVRGIAEAHGGALTVESPPGQGASIHLALPITGSGRDRDRAAGRRDP